MTPVAAWESKSSAMSRIVVTGGSGQGGRAVVRDLLEHGYEVLSVDLRPPQDGLAPSLLADLTDFGETVEALRGADAVVHLAAIRAPGIYTDEVTFRVNVGSTYNVFTAATTLKLERVVWASSETTYGIRFNGMRPDYVPVDEEHPLRPQSSYALSKVLGEEMARQISRMSGLPFVGLRISHINDDESYPSFPGFQNDPHVRKWNLWAYVDARDVALACRLGLEKPISGADVFSIVASDTVMNRPSSELMAEIFPDVPIRKELGEHETLMSIEKARQMLGYEPQHSWRDHVAASPDPPSGA